MNRTGIGFFVALLVASAAVAAVVVHARTPDLELQVTGFTSEICPQGSPRECRDMAARRHPARAWTLHRRARLAFFVRESDPNATAQIVGPNLSVIRTFHRGPLAADREVTYDWNGRDSSGRLVDPHERYRLRVILPSRDRDMVYPRRIQVLEAGAAR
jgi:hypothetical protein